MRGVLLKQLTCPQAGDLIMHMVVTTAVCLEANLLELNDNLVSFGHIYG